jgi:hypothetical protein
MKTEETLHLQTTLMNKIPRCTGVRPFDKLRVNSTAGDSSAADVQKSLSKELIVIEKFLPPKSPL